MKKIIFISGSYPPDICGVGDYTAKLIQSDISHKHNWGIYYKSDWSYKNIAKYIKDINKSKPTHLILQYPTQGYGWSLVPHFMCIYFSLFSKIRFISVIHEFSNATFKNRLAEMILILFSNVIIVTNDFENKSIRKCIPCKKNIKTIHICSNITASSTIKDYNERIYDFIYFGHIRPNKGIEDFINLLKNEYQYFKSKKIAIIGQIPIGFEAFFYKIKKELENYTVDFILNKPETEIAQLLNSAKFAYLPFPDGVSERRGSFLACIFNGVNVITTEGKYTTDELRNCVFIPQGHQDIVKYMSSMTHEKYIQVQERLLYYTLNVIPTTWNDVAKKYLEIL